MKQIQEQEIAIFLAGWKSCKRKVGRPRTSSKPPVDAPRALLENFRAYEIVDALMDGKRRINLGWYVEHLLKIFHSKTSKQTDRLMVLDRLKELMVLGALQQKDMATFVRTKGAGAKEKLVDPFAPRVLSMKPGRKKERKTA